MHVKVGSAWKDGIPWVKVGSTWKKAVAEWVKVGNVWKKVAYAFNNIVLGTVLTESKYSGGREILYYTKDRNTFTKSDPEYPVSTVQVYSRKKSSAYNAYVKLRFTDVNESSRLINALERNTAFVRVIGTGSQAYSKANAKIEWNASLKELTVTPNSGNTMYNMLLGQFRANKPAQVKIEYKD